MRTAVIIRRFFLPPIVVTAIAYFRYRAKLSIRAEIELSPLLLLGKNVEIGPEVKIKASEGRIVIGARTRIGAGAIIAGHDQGVIIGEDCIIGVGVTIMGVNYRYDRVDIPIRDQGLVSKGPILIGDNVQIGDGAVILDAVQIESGAIVAPRAVITAKVRAAPPPDVVAARTYNG